MSLSAAIREQLISSFRADLAEHVQTMTDGLLALEQGQVTGEDRRSTLQDVFRAAHSLKGAARALGVTAVEQLAHALESVLDSVQRDALEPSPELFTACYQALDALQEVQAAYEAGATTPPVLALEALVNLEPFLPLASSRPGPSTGSGKSPDSMQDSDAHPPEPNRPSPPTQDSTGSADTQPGTSDGAGSAQQDRGRKGSTHEFPIREAEGEGQNGLPAPLVPPGEAEEEPAAATVVRPVDETIRVSVNKLDSLMAQLSELLVTKIRAEQRLDQVRQLHQSVGQWQREWLTVRSAYGRLAHQSHEVNDALGAPEPSRWPRPRPQKNLEGISHNKDGARLAKDVSLVLNFVGANQDLLQSVQALTNDLSRQYANDTTHMSLVIDELEQEIKRVRMLPLTTITGPFARMVRDLATGAGKEAVLQIVGGDTEIDRRVLERIKDPLIHMLRNAVDHGIELPDERLALGKPRSGTIILGAEQTGNNIVIRVSDDGAGLNLEGIRRALARRGFADAQALTEGDLVEAIFQPGISTSPIITDISGRGVGLDVVRRNVEALHGRIDQSWTPGGGTTLTLTLPLTLTSSRGLLVRVSNQLFAIPFNAIVRIDEISPQDVVSLEGHDAMFYDGRPLTLVRLGDVLGLPSASASPNGRVPYVVVAAAERRMAFAVDALVDEREVVIKGLGKQLSRVGGILGATVMGSGEVILIVNVSDLIKLAMRGERRAVLDPVTDTDWTSEPRAERQILVVDDSITTRTLEKNILEAEGYVVQLATDGVEALTAIALSGLPDLIVTDIVMPRMDGFELTERLKEDPQTSDVPVILVTSLDSPEDKARGIEVGADAYIVKSGFDQNNLLETIEQLI